MKQLLAVNSVVRSRVGATATLLLVWSGLLYGQGGSSGTIQGTVMDSAGAVIPNASVQVKNVGTGQERQAPTDGQGRYAIPDLNIGNYEVQASAQGFQTTVRRGITLTVGSRSVVDFTLTVGASQQTVTVEGQVSQVDTVSSAVSSYVEQKQINDLPLNGRNFTDLVALVPGVASGGGVGAGAANLLYGTQNNFSVSGARAEGQAYLLDSTDIQGFWSHGSGSGILGTTLGIEAIAEFSVLTNTYSAQFGGNGAAVNAVSKNGTNQFHGSLYEFLRNSKMDARNFYDGSQKPAFRQNQYGGSIGGPIKKDKLFFFVNDEQLRRSLGSTRIAFVPDDTIRNLPVCSGGATANCVSPLTKPLLDLYPSNVGTSPAGFVRLPQVDSDRGTENYLLARVDYTISDKDSLFVRYVNDRGNATFPFLGSPLPPRFPESGLTRNQFTTVEYRRTISPTMVNQLRFSFTRTRESDVQANPNQQPPLNFFPERGQNGGVNITGLTSLGTSIFAPLLQVQNKFPLSDDVFWSRGSHSLRFGGVFSRVQSNFQQQGWWGGFYTFPSIAAFLAGTPSLFQGPIPGKTDSYRDFREIEVDGYIHDEWRATRKLTVNAGLRYEFITNPTTNKHELNAIIAPPFGTYQRVTNVFAKNPSTKNFDPRIGLAFDPFKDHKTAIRAGFGIFYNPIRARTYASGYYFNTPYALAFIPFPSFPNPFPAGTPLPSPAQLVGVDYNANATPRMYQWNINIQRQLMEATSLTIGYVGSRGLHLYTNRDINPVQPSVVNGTTVFGVPRGGGAVGIALNPRLNPAAASLSSAAPVADSNYHSLQLGVNRRFSRGLQSQLSYTWSKCLDNASGTSGLEGGIPWTAPLNGSFDHGKCLFDRPQVLRLSGVYALPFKNNILVKGWQLSGGFNVQSGSPWNVIIGFDQAGNGVANQRPNIVLSRADAVTGDILGYGNRAAFTLPAAGTFGNLQRDSLRAPGIKNLDLSITKETTLHEQTRLQFRAEFFNLPNHANFGVPNANAFVQSVNGTATPNPTFGQITNTSTAARQVQLALKLLF